MSMDSIRRTYNVPAKRGGKVRFGGFEGVIVGSREGRLRIRFERVGIVTVHPKWMVEYLDSKTEQEGIAIVVPNFMVKGLLAE